MKCRRGILLPFLLAAIAAAAVGGCQKPERKAALPEETPEVAVLEFGGPEGGWPPLPIGAQNVTLVSSSEVPVTLTESLGAQLQQTALADIQVRQLLGERFVFIGADELESDKTERPQIAEDLATRLTFFSHTNNVAVEVRMQGSRVESVERKAGYQPPEGAEEIHLAVQLARRDSRIREKAADLEAAALVAFPQKDQPGYGNRVLYVSFSKAGEGLAEYMALVDLTAQKVLAAGPVAGP
jgi:hypothetical protein